MKKYSFNDEIKNKKLQESLKYAIMDKIYEKKYKKMYFKKLAYSFGIILLLAFTLLIGYNYGKHTQDNKTTLVFKLKRPDAESVKLVGDFNNWNREGINLKNQNGYWKTQIKLEEGSYRYFFIVDGKVVLDPANPTIDDPFGDKLSLVNVYQEGKDNRL
ncbi:MAG: hypothetical protein FXF47_02505 [Candidatus Mcinerneyibacterium aminivorans]|jgi:hypothetical protein|uniref:AMP-activated protein kinase glycogen-binding domain-containing protein n=1 Tax=Candidatus Mcinerneyibacterium aminivorans TaxID=2703815 RepID=A0A5D0MJP8_9BACT|nr:MAG: hypothetical protein FXF47_02505 [Candidatus Mcinerneyibacterium aminivorans]